MFIIIGIFFPKCLNTLICSCVHCSRRIYSSVTIPVISYTNYTIKDSDCHNNIFSVQCSGSVVVDFLFIVIPIVGVCNCSMFCCTLLYVNSSIAIILIGKRDLVALLNLSSWCLVMVGRLFLAVPRGCLRFVIVVFPDHTHYFLCLGQDFWGGGHRCPSTHCSHTTTAFWVSSLILVLR